MVNVGPLEILVVAIIALIVLGPQRLPEVARSVGRGMREFRSALTDAGGRDDEDDNDIDDEIEPPDEAEAEADYQNDAESSESSSSSRDLV
jgi:sec-independent protein translocase protein TatA